MANTDKENRNIPWDIQIEMFQLIDKLPQDFETEELIAQLEVIVEKSKLHISDTPILAYLLEMAISWHRKPTESILQLNHVYVVTSRYKTLLPPLLLHQYQALERFVLANRVIVR